MNLLALLFTSLREWNLLPQTPNCWLNISSYICMNIWETLLDLGSSDVFGASCYHVLSPPALASSEFLLLGLRIWSFRYLVPLQWKRLTHWISCLSPSPHTLVSWEMPECLTECGLLQTPISTSFTVSPPILYLAMNFPSVRLQTSH